MAIDFGKIAATKESFKLVSSKDSSLAEDFQAEEYQNYLKTLDENILRRAPDNTEPFTYFHLKSSVKLEDALAIENETMGFARAQQEGKMPFASLAMAMAKSALIDVTVDGKSVMPKTDSKPSEAFLIALVRTRIVYDIYSALEAQGAGISGQNTDLAKKN